MGTNQIAHADIKCAQALAFMCTWSAEKKSACRGVNNEKSISTYPAVICSNPGQDWTKRNQFVSTCHQRISAITPSRERAPRPSRTGRLVKSLQHGGVIECFLLQLLIDEHT